MAFAGNSVLCRLALGNEVIDAASFTWVRLFSGAIVLSLILQFTRSGGTQTTRGSWWASLMLFLYAITFSYAYISLDTGTGALILFASVQITIILTEIVTGKKLLFVEWTGVIVAFAGFVYLVSPTLSTPSFNGFLLMMVSGIGWGYYTLAGKASKNPLGDTTFNFARTLPLIVFLVVMTIQRSNLSMDGILLAIVSGGVTSGIGYTIWYIALRGLSATQAAVLQLLVPVIATFGGVLFAGEQLTTRLVFASAIILGGILTLILGRQHYASKSA